MMNRISQVVVALASGAVFGLGLSLSGMLDPARVQGFLDVFGAWDPSLAFVLGGAVAVAMIGTALMRRMVRPILDTAFHLPTATTIDARLVLGSAIFGVGWGLAGFCPGPALSALSLGLVPVVAFVAAMVVGMVVHDRLVPVRSA
jgi:uncharacterized membrane protein YedE/YeeE